MADSTEPIDWNEVKAYFEAQDKKISIVADGVVGLTAKFSRWEPKWEEMADDIKLLKVICRGNTDDIRKNTEAIVELTGKVDRNTKDIKILKKDVTVIKGSVGRIEKRLTTVEDRLSVVEARPSP